MGVPGVRNLDVSVTLDLMIHDIDLALALAGTRPDEIKAEMIADRNGLADHVRTTLHFPGGVTAELESSRVAEARDRIMTIAYDGGAEVAVDFIARTFDNPAGLPLDPDFQRTPSAQDSLGANVAAFLAAVRGESESCAADGAAGLAALERPWRSMRPAARAAASEPAFDGGRARSKARAPLSHTQSFEPRHDRESPLRPQPHRAHPCGQCPHRLMNVLFARSAGGRFLLRIDDTDLERSTKGP
jgi:hypothetical protein